MTNIEKKIEELLKENYHWTQPGCVVISEKDLKQALLDIQKETAREMLEKTKEEVIKMWVMFDEMKEEGRHFDDNLWYKKGEEMAVSFMYKVYKQITGEDYGP